MSWLAEHWLELLPTLISLAAFGATIRWHCKNDDRQFGEMKGRLDALERRK